MDLSIIIDDVTSSKSAFFQRPDALRKIADVIEFFTREDGNLHAFVKSPVCSAFIDCVAGEVLLRHDTLHCALSETQLFVLLLQLLDMMCDVEASRAMVARKWLQAVLGFVGGAARHGWDVSRNACSLLVNIVKGSEEACRPITDLGVVAEGIKGSTDIYFQLQCLEVMYRVMKKSKVLKDSVAAVMGHAFATQLEKIPNNAKMLPSMITLLQSVNGTSVCPIKVSSITCGQKQMKESVAYFGRKVVVLDWHDADMTVPYEAVRSVKLSRAKELVLRFHTIPLSMGPFYVEGAEPVLVMGITEAEFQKMKDANVHKWIRDEMEAHMAQGHATARDFVSTPPPCPTFPTSQQPEKRKLEEMRTQHDAPPDSPESKKRVSPPRPLASLADKENVLPSQRPYGLAPVVHAVPSCSSAISRATVGGGQHSSSSNNSALIQNEVEPMLTQLREIVTQKFAVRQREGTDILNEAVQHIQREVEGLRQRNAVHYREYEHVLQHELSRLRTEQGNLKKKMAQLTEKLNSDIDELNVQNTNVGDQMTSIELEFQQVLHTMKREEDDAIMVMNRRLESEMGQLEAKVQEAVLSANPLRFVTQFLSNSTDVGGLA